MHTTRAEEGDRLPTTSDGPPDVTAATGRHDLVTLNRRRFLLATAAVTSVAALRGALRAGAYAGPGSRMSYPSR